MVRPNGNGAARRPSGSGAASVIAGIAAFSVVCGTLWFVAKRQPSQPAVVAKAAPAAKPAPEVKPSEVADARPAAQSAAVAPSKAARPVKRDVAETIAAHLSAGEFGPAYELAVAAKDADERTRLLKLVVTAQIEAGDFEGAQATIRRIPNAEERLRLFGERASQESLAGGGSLANFQPLIDLIMQETSGPWEEIDGTGGTISSFDTGVRVDAKGVLALASKEERDGRLAALGTRARAADLNTEMSTPSELRLVSLTRLEKEVSRRLAAGEPVLETMKHFAGLSQIQYIFVTEEGEVVVGGPAEGWRYDDNGLPVGATSGRPTLQLDDFVTVLRTFQPGGLGMFQCLIVPREEGLRSVKEFVAQSNARGPLPAGGAVKNWVNQLQQKLGMQDVVVNGVPGDSRVARVIVEADYRMKLIGVDKLDGGKAIPSYFDLLTPDQQKNAELDALRWWMTMKYDAVLHSPDHRVFEIQGSAVKCLSENEFITAEGKRVHTGKSELTNRLFAQNFTNGYEQLAERDVIFADLQNIFDLSLVGALLSDEQSQKRLDWNLGCFAAQGGYQPARFATPKAVMSVVNHRVYGGKDIVVQVAGGVRADLKTVVQDKNIVREQPRLSSLADRGKAPNLPEGRWWWDAAK